MTKNIAKNINTLGTNKRFIVGHENRFPAPTPMPTKVNNPTTNELTMPNNIVDRKKITIVPTKLYLNPHLVPMIPTAAGVTKNDKNPNIGKYTLMAVSTTPMALTNAVSTIALVFVCFIILHSILKGY
jgi:hypothetical protein